MGTWQCAVLLLPAIFVFVTGQDVPTSYPYDCRRTAVGCGNGAMCNPNDGTCACQENYQGADCKLETSSVKTCPADNTCENNAICYDDGGSTACYCDSNTYGTKCENPRANVWCTGSDMFINLYPHGDSNFSGKLFVSTPSNDGRDREACLLKKVNDSLDLTGLDHVKTVQGDVPTLLGYYIILPHNPADGVPACTDAVMTSNNESTNYTQRVVVEYNNKMITGVDQVFSFTCNVVKTVGNFTSDNAMSVKIVGSDDYDTVNATDKIEPVSFVIETPEGTAVTNTVGLGDPLNLVFTLLATEADTGSGYADFKVTQCTATNSATGAEAVSIDFLTNDCPAPGSELLYRGNIVQKSDTGTRQTIIPLSAFRFVGNVDQVAFTCHLKLCTANDTLEDPEACKKAICPTDVLDQDPNAGGGDIGTVNNTDSGTANGTDTGTTNETTDGTNGTADGTDTTNTTDTAPPDTQPPPVRRRRAADDRNKEVTQIISVSSGYSKKGQEEEEGNSSSVQKQDCMQHTQVVTVIIIFSVIVFILLLVIVGLVLRQLRTRAKVVDANETSSDTLSRYSLPRLSVATTI